MAVCILSFFLSRALLSRMFFILHLKKQRLCAEPEPPAPGPLQWHGLRASPRAPSAWPGEASDPLCCVIPVTVLLPDGWNHCPPEEKWVLTSLWPLTCWKLMASHVKKTTYSQVAVSPNLKRRKEISQCSLPPSRGCSHVPLPYVCQLPPSFLDPRPFLLLPGLVRTRSQQVLKIATTFLPLATPHELSQEQLDQSMWASGRILPEFTLDRASSWVQTTTS